MAVEFTTNSFTTNKQILVFPDHYVAVAQHIPQGSPLAATVDGRQIVRAGTIVPANDATAWGVVMNDVDVTNGDREVAVIIHGFLKTAALPVAPDTTAITALNMIKFMPQPDFASTPVPD